MCVELRPSHLQLGVTERDMKPTHHAETGLHSEKLAVSQDLFPDGIDLAWPLEGRSFSGFSTFVVQRKERRLGLIFLEGSLCAKPCALHITLFKPHRAPPDG